MFNTKKVAIEWGGKTLTLETGKVARQADGAVIATLGETVVLCAVTAAKNVKEGQDFFPLTVHYQEKFSSAGRIPGGFFKRERGATERETLISRLIDRPIRPLFPEGFYNEINCICQVLSYDGENEPDILALVAASAALTISGVPFMGPIGAARVGYVDGEYQLNPTDAEALAGDLDLVVAATHDAVMMVESEAKELSEEVMLGAVMFAHKASQQIIDAIIDLAEQAAKDPWELKVGDDQKAVKAELKKLVGKDITAAYKLTEASGFYQKNPGTDVAVTQMIRKTTDKSRGIRLGNFVQIRTIIDEETEQIWTGKKTPQQALDTAVTRGNEQLGRFARANK